MKLTNYIATATGLVAMCHAQLLGIPDEYSKLLNFCEGAGPDAYVGVQYANTPGPVSFVFGQCYPYQDQDGNLAQMAVFCKTVTCYNNPNPDCTGGAVPPVGIPILAGLTLLNVADFVQLLGQGATCQRNGLS